MSHSELMHEFRTETEFGIEPSVRWLHAIHMKTEDTAPSKSELL